MVQPGCLTTALTPAWSLSSAEILDSPPPHEDTSFEGDRAGTDRPQTPATTACITNNHQTLREGLMLSPLG